MEGEKITLVPRSLDDYCAILLNYDQPESQFELKLHRISKFPEDTKECIEAVSIALDRPIVFECGARAIVTKCPYGYQIRVMDQETEYIWKQVGLHLFLVWKKAMVPVVCELFHTGHAHVRLPTDTCTTRTLSIFDTLYIALRQEIDDLLTQHQWNDAHCMVSLYEDLFHLERKWGDVKIK